MPIIRQILFIAKYMLVCTAQYYITISLLRLSVMFNKQLI